MSPTPDLIEALERWNLRDPAGMAAEIGELTESIFGPFDPEVAEGWALSAAEDLKAATLRRLLTEAAGAQDPLAVLAPHREARAVLERHMRARWSSSRQARALGHPPGLEGQTWSALSESARNEVHDALEHLRSFWAGRVRRNRPRRDDLDTFLRELADLYVLHAAEQGDRAARARGPLWHLADVPHSARSRFIQLAALVLAGLPPLPSGELRVSLLLRTPRGLSERWRRIKAQARSEPRATEEPETDGSAPPLS